MQEKIKKHLILLCVLGGIIFPSTGWGQMHPARALRLKQGVEPVRVQVTSSENLISLDYQVPSATFTSQGEEVTCCGGLRTKTKVSVGNAYSSRKEGKPVLPFIPATIILPAGKEIDTIIVTRSGEIQYEDEYFIEYGGRQVPISCEECAGEEATCDCPVYSSDTPYPQEAYNLQSVQKKHGVSLAYINLNPVSYLPFSEKVIIYTELSLEITLEDASIPPCAEIVAHPERIDVTSLPVENPDALYGYYDIDCPRPPDRSSPAGFCDPASAYEYVIVTNDAIKNAVTTPNINNLLNDRQTNKGLTATIVTIEDIYANFPGRDNPENLRNFIIDAYNNWETEYVLLGGDVEVVPMRKLWVYVQEWFDTLNVKRYDSLPSDVYYQCLDGSFNADNDDKWGEIREDAESGDKWVDILAEIYIGRASAEDADEMLYFVQKTLQYENNSETHDYEPLGLFVGMELYPDPKIYSASILNQIINGIGVLSPAQDYVSLGFKATPVIGEHELYDSTHPQGNWIQEDIIDSINSNKFTIINHLGHSAVDNSMRMANGDEDSLTNTNLIFAYSQGCKAGNFEEDCIAERFTTENEYGMFAGVYNSRVGFWGGTGDPDNGASHHLNRQFWDAYFCEGILAFSGMCMDSKEDNIPLMGDIPDSLDGATILWCYYCSNLFGDPYTDMWIPREMNLKHYPLSNAIYPYKQVYKARNTITIMDSTVVTVAPNTWIDNCTFISGRTINLKPEFVTQIGAKVKAFIDTTLYRP